MFFFNKEEAHNLNLILKERTEAKFATTEVDTRGYYLGYWQRARNYSLGNQYLQIFSSTGVEGTWKQLWVLCLPWFLGLESCKFGHWDLWGAEHTLSFAFSCQVHLWTFILQFAASEMCFLYTQAILFPDITSDVISVLCPVPENY